jgi:RNA polymerase sigma-70 factor, ECF subfamily
MTATAASDAPQPMDPDQERALVEGLCRRDPDAVQDFLERTHRNVFAMACRMTPEAADREDWTHDVLLRIVDELGRGRFVYRWPGCFWSWFAMRCRFLLLNHLRRHRTHQQRHQSEVFDEDAVACLVLPSSVSPDRLVEGVQARATIEACIEKLSSEDHRRALTLLLLEEMSYQEIADQMAAQLNTVRSWIRRARSAVRQCVALAYELPLAEEDA